MGFVFQEPSRAAMVCETVELFVNVTGMPTFVRTREGLTPWSSAQSTFLFADAMLNVLTVPSWIAAASSMRPAHSRVIAGGTGAGRGGTVPPILKAQTARLFARATNCSPRLS